MSDQHTASSDVAVVLQRSALQLNNALAEGSPAKTAVLLELISRLAASGGACKLPGEAAAQLYSACALALGDPSPEVAARAALALGAAVQLCQRCSGGQDTLQHQQQLATVAQHAVAAMQRHTAEPAVAAAGLHLLLRLAGCPCCRSPISREQQELLGVAGAVPAAVSALCVLCAAAQPAAPEQGATAGGAAGDDPLPPAQQQAAQLAQQRVLALGEGLQALHHMCAGHGANLAQLAAAGPAGGMQAVVAAMAAASSEWPAEEYGLLLLALLACREGAPAAEQQAAAVAIWQAAQAQVERRLVEVGRAAVWGMARVLQRLLAPDAAARGAAGGAGGSAALVPELLLAMLQSCDKKDDPLMKHCCDFLSVAASAAAQQPAVAAALLSREAATAVLVVAGQAGQAHTQASALRTLCHLCQAGGCGLTWQDLAAGRQPEAAELVAGGASIAAAVFVVMGAAGAAAAAAAKDAARPQRDALSVQLYGLAAVGALLAATELRCPAAAAMLAAQLQREQLAAAQEAVAAACGVLGRSPELLALLEEQSGAEEAGSEPAILLDATIGCHPAVWQEPLTWRPAADAVRGMVALLRSAPEGVNTPDREGCTLLHRLALAGHARCLELLLQLAPPASDDDGTDACDVAAPGSALDLLVRTRTGANALQLARQARHDACAALLEGATQRAAEARQAALLAELEEMEAEEGGGAGAKKGKKKKAVSRNTSFAAEQPEGKAQKLGSSCSSEQDDDMPDQPAEGTELDAALAAQQAQHQRELELRLQAQLEREEAYERALEARRQELAAQQAAQQAALLAAAAGSLSAPGPADDAMADGLAGLPTGEDTVAGEPSLPSSDGQDQPGTPDQQDDQPATPNAAQAAGATAAQAGDASASQNSSSGGSNSPEPPAPGEDKLAGTGGAAADPAVLQPPPGLLGGGAGLASFQARPLGLPSLGPLQLQARRAPPSQQQPVGGLSAAMDLPTSGGSGGQATSLFAEPAAPTTAGSSLFGSPALVGGLLGDASPHSAMLGSSLPSSVAGSPFLHCIAAGSPTSSRPIAGYGCPSPPGSAAPFPSPAGGGLLLQQRSGLPPLPGSRQQSLGAALAVAGGSGAAAPAAAAASPADTDQLLSMHLQDALFVGSPAPSPGRSGLVALHQGSPQQRHSLFAALSPRGSAEAAAAAAQDDAHSMHLLSSSLSCLDEGGATGEALLARNPSASRSGSGSGSGSGSMSAAADQLMASLRQHQAGWPGSGDGPGGLGGDVTVLLGGGAAASAFPTSQCAAPLSPACSAPPGLSGLMADSNSDESAEPTRHLWIGNLGTRTPRQVLKTIFERFGIVDDVVTFPGRMYAFVNYRATEEAMAAFDALQDKVVPELTGDRRLLIKYRPAKKAAIHLRALGLVDEDGSPTEDRLDLDRDGNSSEPSPRIWLGNIAPTATSKNLHAVLGRFGALTDAAVFPARIGPLGYAFVKFERLEDATRAFEALNNTVVPPLSGSKQLKMRYKPANDGPVGRGEDPSDPGKAVMVPSRHLWLGNITQKPTDEQVLEVFASFGKVDSVRVFPVKAYAFVNYADIGSAIKAMQAVDGLAIPQLTGVKPLVMRYQQESGGSAASTPKPPGSAGSSASSLLPRVASEAAMSAALGLNQLVPGSSLASLLAGVPGPAGGHLRHEGAAGSDDGLVPVPNLSNKLNPNNIHYDPALAERYKHMNRREKDLMWAADSLLHPSDPHKSLMRSQSSGLLHSHSHGPSSSTAAAAAAATAQAHAAMAVLLQSQQHQGGAGGMAGGAPSGSLLTSQLLALQQLAPEAPPAQPSQIPTGASASQLTAVLNNLTAMRRSGSMPATPGAGLGLQSAASMPLPGHGAAQAQHVQQQADYLQQLLLAQQAQQQAQHAPPQSPALTPMSSFNAGSVPPASPSHQIHQLSSLLAGQSLGSSSGAGSARAATPLLSASIGTPTDMLSPQHSSGLGHTQHTQQSLAAALGQLGTGAAAAPPSPAGLAQHPHLPSPHASPGGPAGLGGGAAGPGASLPRCYYCPLSQQVMTDPVVAADGVTYERQAISEWLAYKDVSPTTQMPLPHKVLTPNAVLRDSLINLLRQHC
ncbi:hypothetical protein ABPG75_004648 [Micractinium tetrahymenae]